MDPSLFTLAKPPTTAPVASTSTQPNGTSTVPSATTAATAMDIDPQLAEPQHQPKTTKELEQDRNDLQLAELLDSMDDWRPIIPDEVTDYYLQKSGFETDDVRVKRLLALAAQRFVSSIASDAYQYARTRTVAGGAAGGAIAASGGKKDASTTSGGRGARDRTRTVLTMDDLSAALKEYGVGAERAPFYL
ncbi:hypothetical protein T439DRAFT_325695 [Meredithblackwellia eburnea MCA 4105]